MIFTSAIVSSNIFAANGIFVRWHSGKTVAPIGSKCPKKYSKVIGVTVGRVLVLIQVAALRAASQAHAPRSHGMKQLSEGGEYERRRGRPSKGVSRPRAKRAGGGGSRARRGASLALTRLPNPRILRRPCIRDIPSVRPVRLILPSAALRGHPLFFMLSPR